MSEDNTRPVSVAELLARNGTIGSPPVGGHRRRKRRNAVSVAELTGELPVIRTGEIPTVVDDDREPVERDEPQPFGEPAVDAADVGPVVVYSSATDVAAEDGAGAVSVSTYGLVETSAEPDYSDYRDYTPGYDETHGYVTAAPIEVVSVAELEVTPEPAAEVANPALPEFVAVRDEVVAERRTEPAIEAHPPLSSVPLPRRRRGPERSHDPRPRRRPTARASGAEQMSPDPVDASVDLAELVAEQVPDPAELRSYLRSSTPTLFFGETVADDLARRGEVPESDRYADYGSADHGSDDYDGDDYEPEDVVDAPRRGALSVLGTSLVAVLQSLLAVVFGAGLFIGFDQLWRWNNIVALALSSLVIAALMIGVHVVRKTEDFVSILIAALVGILVTFGPLALQST